MYPHSTNQSSSTRVVVLLHKFIFNSTPQQFRSKNEFNSIQSIDVLTSEIESNELLSLEECAGG